LWSVDGATLYFNHIPLDSIYEYPPGSGQILQAFNLSLEGFWKADSSGQGMRRIYEGLDSPTLSRDGAFVLFNAHGQIWKVTFAGDSIDPASAIQVTNSSSGAFGPAISWSGQRLLYFVATGASPGIFIGSSSGGFAQRIGDPGWFSPDWIPGDTSFAFTGYWPQVVGIGVADTNGTNAVQIASEAMYPRVSPTGRRIAYLSHPSAGGAAQLWVVNRDGSQPLQLTTEGCGDGFSWSPDGNQIAYVRFSSVDPSYTNGTIWTINVATMAKRQITFNPSP